MIAVAEEMSDATFKVHDEPEPVTMIVPAVTPVPERPMPGRRAPDVTAATVSVVPEIDADTTGRADAVIETLETVCATLTVHVHGKLLKMEHEPNVTTVSGEIPAPATTMPTTSAPEATAVTVSVVPATEPVSAAVGNAGSAASPAGQKKPTRHAFVVPDGCAATQKKPAGHGFC